MPIIHGKNAINPTDEFTCWGLAKFNKGLKNITELHYHDCDEFILMVEGRMHIRSEGIEYTLEKGDVLVTRMGDEHEVLEILEDTTYFWFEGPLRGQKRTGHLIRPAAGSKQ